MKSLDSNILIYASDENAQEHEPALAVVEDMLDSTEDWVLADQVLFEYYKALRNPKIFRHPLGPQAAASRLHFLASESGVPRCCYELNLWERVLQKLEKKDFPYQRTHDLILSATLRNHGVTRFYTRNIKDFETAGFRELINPIDG